jgi:site-specific DNA-methyltransferase (adenine-specific)
MTTAGLVWLLRQVAVRGERILSDTGSLLVFCDWRMAFSLGPALESAGLRLRNLIVWDKGSFGCGTGFRPRHELILHLTKRAPAFYTADIGNVLMSKRVPSRDRSHPTEKPVDLLASLIRVVCPPGGKVLDPFAGSGAMGEAAISEGRTVILIEREPGYVADAKRRLERYRASGVASTDGQRQESDHDAGARRDRASPRRLGAV